MSAMDDEQLITAAIDARRRAYAPYSNFQVGAALLCADGSVCAGGNIENASYSLTICAERVAAANAVAMGCRDFVRIAIAAELLATPCGACRQFLSEFNPELDIISVDVKDRAVHRWNLRELLPHQFQLRQS